MRSSNQDAADVDMLRKLSEKVVKLNSTMTDKIGGKTSSSQGGDGKKLSSEHVGQSIKRLSFCLRVFELRSV